MAVDPQSEDELARDIGYALWHSPFRVKRGQDIETCTTIAREVVAHLRRSLWIFQRAPPDAPHSTSIRAITKTEHRMR
jgi:hypothetical protein